MVHTAKLSFPFFFPTALTVLPRAVNVKRDCSSPGSLSRMSVANHLTPYPHPIPAYSPTPHPQPHPRSFLCHSTSVDIRLTGGTKRVGLPQPKHQGPVGPIGNNRLIPPVRLLSALFSLFIQLGESVAWV